MRYLAGIIILGLTVLFHEFGHFLFARLSHITVEEFAVGMGPKLISHKSKKSGTVYALKLLPFGGSCAMLNEDEGEKVPGSFVGAKLWQRALVVAAGPVFNFILAFVLSVIVVASAGADPATVVEVAVGSAEEEAGLQEGDLILSFDGHSVLNSRDLYYTLIMNETSTDEITMKVLRDGEKLTLTYAPDTETRYMMGFYYDEDENGILISMISNGSPLKDAGLQMGDYITAINGTEVSTVQELQDYLAENPLDGSAIVLDYSRNDRAYTSDEIYPTERTLTLRQFSYSAARVPQSLGGIIKYSFYEVGFWVKMVWSSLAGMFTGQFSLNDMSGPVGIVKTVGDAAGDAATAATTAGASAWTVVLTILSMMSMISANLGLVNLFPLPALDGGRLLLMLIEAIRRKPSNQELEAKINYVGFMALMALIVYITVHDIMKLF